MSTLTPAEMIAVAQEAQRQARFLAPYQNYWDVRLAPRGLFRRLLWWLFPPRPRDLTSQQVTDILNALLNAGNVLETQARRSPQCPPPTPSRTPPPPAPTSPAPTG